MTATLTVPPVHEPAPGKPPRVWRGATRIAFRFCVLYFGLYVVFTQMLRSVFRLAIPAFGQIPPMYTLVSWTASHVFHVTGPLVTGGGSGDKIYDWVQVLCMLVLAVTGTAVWSVFGRRALSYTRLHTGFHVFARVALGATMIQYGMSKAIPNQMPEQACCG